MSAVKVFRATTGWSDGAWAAALAVIGALLGFIGALAEVDPTPASLGMKFVPLAGMPLMFRYQFASARSVLFWFDASRQAIPGVSAVCARTEVFRFMALLACLFMPMVATAWIAPGALSPMLVMLALAVALAAVAIGALAAVMPYRWMTVAMILNVGLVLLIVTGSLPTDGVTALMVAGIGFVIAMALVTRRLRALRRLGADPAVGGDYAFAFSLGRHSGTAFDAPNSAPFAVLFREHRERRGAAKISRIPADQDARVLALLGEAGWRHAIAPRRHAMLWGGMMLGWPALMVGFFTVMYTLDPGRRPISEMLPVLATMLFVMWGFMMNGALQAGAATLLAAGLRDTGALHAELRLLPGVSGASSRWDRRLRPLWLPASLATAVSVLGVAALAGVSPTGMAFLTAVGALELVRMRISTHAALFGASAAQRFSIIGGALTGLALTYGFLVWMTGISPNFDKLTAELIGKVGVDPAVPTTSMLLIAAMLLGVGALRLHTGRDRSLLREAGP